MRRRTDDVRELDWRHDVDLVAGTTTVNEQIPGARR